VIKLQYIILAGGSGERFWPLSTRETPKQFLKLFGDKTLIRQTFERIAESTEPEKIFVITSKDQVERTSLEIPEIPSENILGEPFRRNTGPACMAGMLMAADSEPVMVLPADHRIPSKEKFIALCNVAAKGSEKLGGLFTFGIRPTRAETGYGYIETGQEMASGIREVLQFHEKPDRKRAESYVEKENYFWNSGMFLWRKADFLEEMKGCSPDVFNALIDMNPHEEDSVYESYKRSPSISIDYALMEKSRNVFNVPADLEWSDVGSWQSIRELEGYSDDGGKNVLVDSKQVFIRNDESKTVGVVGLEGIIVVNTSDGLLIASEEEAQKVREVAKRIKGEEI